jgi:hypothetical protein
LLVKYSRNTGYFTLNCNQSINTYKTSLTRANCNDVHVPSTERERPCLWVLGQSILTVSTMCHCILKCSDSRIVFDFLLVIPIKLVWCSLAELRRSGSRLIIWWMLSGLPGVNFFVSVQHLKNEMSLVTWHTQAWWWEEEAYWYWRS